MADNKVSLTDLTKITDLSSTDVFLIAHDIGESNFKTRSCELSTLQNKVLEKVSDVIQFDETPTENSEKLVKSKDIKAYVDEALSAAIYGAVNMVYTYTEEEING